MLRIVPFLVTVIAFVGCAPALTDYKPDVRLAPEDVLPAPKVHMTLGVVNLKDSRPPSERFNLGMAVYDSIVIPLSMGALGLMRLDPTDRAQPIGGIDNSMSDYLSFYIENANLFDDVIRIRQKTELLARDVERIQLLKGKADIVLLGEIKRCYGVWETGGMISQTEHEVPTSSLYSSAKQTTTTYALSECYGITSLSLQVIETESGTVIWTKDIESRHPCEGNITLWPFRGNIPERNRLAAASFQHSIIDVITELRKWVTEGNERKRGTFIEFQSGVVPGT